MNWYDLSRTLIVAVGVLVAITSICASRSTAKKKQSIELLMASREDQILQKGLEVIRNHHSAPDKNMRFIALECSAEEKAAIKYVLNHFEIVSIGIQKGIYDSDMLNDCWHTLLTSVYDMALPLIKSLREERNVPTYLQEFEWLYNQWKKKPLTVK